MSNQEICAAFRKLLTEGFEVPEGVDRDKALAETKAWRAKLWKAFHEIQSRMCPQPPRRD